MSTVEAFVRAHQLHWETLEALLARARGDLRRLDAAELEELGRLYRRAASDLAIVQRDYPGDRVVLYLRQVFSRAHAQVYRAPTGVWRRVLDFFLVEFPQVYRANLACMLVSMARGVSCASRRSAIAVSRPAPSRRWQRLSSPSSTCSF